MCRYWSKNTVKNLGEVEVFKLDTQKPFSNVIQCHFDYACSFWYPGLCKVFKNFRLPKIKTFGLFLTWIQGHV